MTVFFKLMVVPVVGLLASAANAPSLTALNLLQPGKWSLVSKDADFAARAICIGDPTALLQVRQPIPACSQFVIANDPTLTTVHYTCRGAGSGRTTVRVETPRLAQIDTQGIANGVPFDVHVEARRVGDCTTLSMR